MEEKVMAPKGDSRLPTLLESLFAVFRIALNNGLATFYVSMLILALGFCCVRGLWERIGLNGMRSSVLNELMQAPQEPLRPDSSPMLSSAVLGKEIARWELCQDGAGKDTNRVIDQGASAFWEAYRATLDKLSTEPNSPPALSEIKQAQPLIGLAPALTDSARTHSPLILPSGLHDYWPRDRDPDPARLSARVQASLAGLDATSSKLPDAMPSSQSAGVVRFFFISVDGFMRYTPAENPDGSPSPSPLPPHRTFNHASYVLEALSGDRPREGSHPCGAAYETVPYFDILGGGVVMTTCRRMPEQVSVTNPAQGVLCADVSLPHQLLLDDIDRNPLIGGDFFVYDESTKLLERCPRQGGMIDCDATARVAAPPKVQQRAQKWLQELETPRPSGYAGASQLTTLTGDRSYDYAAVLWNETQPDDHGGKPHILLGLVLFDVPPYTFDLICWTWLGGAVLCLSLLVYLLARQRVRLAKARVFALQRGLSVGVVRVDADDGIVGVNDRAEFLLGVKLPRLGLLPRAGLPKCGEVRFQAFVDTGHIVVRDGNRLRVRPYSDVAGLRKEGVSSVYWIRVPRRKRWLRVTGAPVFEPAQSDHQSTVGLLEPAEESMREELERHLTPKVEELAKKEWES